MSIKYLFVDNCFSLNIIEMFQGKTANYMQYSPSSFVMPLIVEV